MDLVSQITMFYGEPDTGVYESMGDDIDQWLQSVTRSAESTPNEEIFGEIIVDVFKTEILLLTPSQASEFEAEYDAELFSDTGADDIAYMVYPDKDITLFSAEYGIVYSPEGIWTAYIEVPGGQRWSNETYGIDKNSLWYLYQNALSDLLTEGYDDYYTKAVRETVDPKFYDVAF